MKLTNIMWINLEISKDRRERMIKDILPKININNKFKITKIDAKDGNSFVNNNTFLTKRELGCYLSHRDCWIKIINNNLSCALILEDDLNIISNNLPIYYENYDVIFLNENFNIINNNIIGWGCQSYIVSNAGARKLLICSKIINSPIDLTLKKFCTTNYIKATCTYIKYFNGFGTNHSTIGDR